MMTEYVAKTSKLNEPSIIHLSMWETVNPNAEIKKNGKPFFNKYLYKCNFGFIIFFLKFVNNKIGIKKINASKIKYVLNPKK